MQGQSGSWTGSFRNRALGSLLLIAIVASLLFFAVPSNDSKLAVNPDELTDKQAINAKRNEEELIRILGGLSPGRLGITSDRIVMLNELNHWFKDQSKSAAPQRAKDDEFDRKYLPPQVLERTLSDRFLPEDASYIRECFLAHDIVSQVSPGLETNLDRIRALFEFVTRYVTLIPADVKQQTPLTPYESLLFGIGSAEDRAWTFAALLKELRIDTVILTPTKGSGENRWLVAVIEPRSGVMLFDTQLGLPIPAPTDDATSAFPKTPATLQQARDSADLLSVFDLPNQPFPITSSALKNVNVKLIGTSSQFAPRMAHLQFLLPSKYASELYDGLGGNELRSPGLVERVIAAGKDGLWTAENVSLWDYPVQQSAQIEAAKGAEGTALGRLFDVFKGPYIPQFDPKTSAPMEPRTSNRSLHLVRIEQLKGDNAQALKDFLPIRNNAFRNIPANALAADYGTVWSGISQFLLNKPELAEQTFQRFAKGHQENPALVRSAVEWDTLCDIQAGRYQDAANLLLQASPSLTPLRDAYLIKRWQKLAASSMSADKSAAADGATSPPAALNASPAAENTPSATADPKPESENSTLPATPAASQSP